MSDKFGIIYGKEDGQANMEKHYDAKAAESKWYAVWEKNGYFHQEPGKGEP